MRKVVPAIIVMAIVFIVAVTVIAIINPSW